MPGHSRTSLILLVAGAVVFGGPTRADAQSTPAVIHACYVPLTGTMYRIKEAGLRTACSSTSHVEFQWTDGDGALRPTGAAAGDLLQFDGTQWKPVNAQSFGGVTGYEVAMLTANNTYQSQPQLVILSAPLGLCSGNILLSCYHVNYVYRVIAPPTTVTLSCPAGKKAFGVFSANDVGSDIVATGEVSANLPQRQRNTPTMSRELAPGISPSPDVLPNLYSGQPSTTPDNFMVKVICANAS